MVTHNLHRFKISGHHCIYSYWHKMYIIIIINVSARKCYARPAIYVRKLKIPTQTLRLSRTPLVEHLLCIVWRTLFSVRIGAPASPPPIMVLVRLCKSEAPPLNAKWHYDKPCTIEHYKSYLGHRGCSVFPPNYDTKQILLLAVHFGPLLSA